MNKKFISAMSLMAVLTLAACGGTSSSVPSSASVTSSSNPVTGSTSGGTPGSSALPPSTSSTPATSVSSTTSVETFDPFAFFDAALVKDYSNSTVESVQQYNDGENVETDFEYCSEGYYVDYNPDLAGMGMDPYIYYFVEDGVSYQYFEKDNYNPNSKSGWLNKGANNVDLSIWNTYFYLPMLLENITSDDVEFYGDLGTSYAYFVNPAVVEELNETAFRYAWFNEILDVTIYVGKDGYINHIQGFSDEDPMITNNYVDIKITNIGMTTLPDGVPSKPTEETKLEYWEYKGWESDYTDAYLTSITATLEEGVESSDPYDVVLDIEHKATISYVTLPESFEPWEMVDETVTLHSTNPDVAILTYGNNNTAVITAIKEGETEVYLSVNGENGVIESEHFKVKVNGLKEQDKTEAVYDFDFISMDEEENISAINKVSDVKAPFTIKSNKGKFLDGKYSEIFDAGKQIFTLDPLSTDFSKPAGASVSFDFGEQQVSSLSVYYGLIYDSHKANLSYLDEAVIKTSNDGVDWKEIDILQTLKDEASGKNKKLLDVAFDPASKVEIYLHSNIVGNSLALGLDGFVFGADERCHDYVAPEDVHVESVTVAPESLDLTIGDVSPLVANVLPSNAYTKDVEWTSNNPSIASVDADGKVTAVAAGTTTVFATSVDGDIKSNEVTITVKEPVTIPENIDGTFKNDLDFPELTVTVNRADNSLDVIFKDYTTTLDLVGLDGDLYEFRNDDGDVLYLSLRNETKLSVDTTNSQINGEKLVPIHQELFKVIPATSFDVVVSGIEMGEDGKYHMIENDSAIVTAKNFIPEDANVKDVKWTISNDNGVYDEEIATFKAVKEGEVTLTATCLHDETVTSSVTFVIEKEVKPTSIEVTSKTGAYEVNKGDKLELEVSYNEGCNRTGVTWSVDNRNIATIDEDGVLTGKAAGTVTVTATSTYDDNVVGTVEVTVLGTTTEGAIPASLIGKWTASDDDLYGFINFEFTINEDKTLYGIEDLYGIEYYATLNEELSTDGVLHYDLDDGSGDYIEIFYDDSGITSVTVDDTNSNLISGTLITFSTVTAW